MKTDKERIEDLERRVKELEDIINRQVPWSPPPFDGPNPWNPWPDTPTPVVPWPPLDEEGTTCKKCGVVWKGIMCYSCPHNDCPMGAGPTIIKT